MLRGDPSGQAAHIDLNPEGFFEVTVDKGHCAQIREGCGLTIEVVQQALQEYNAERESAAATTQGNNAVEEEEDMINLDPASNEEYETGNEVF